MPRLCKLFTCLTLLLFMIRSSIGQCALKTCEKESLNLATDTKHNLFLQGYVLETLSFSSWKDCYFFCMKNCQCLSFNFYEASNKTSNCELNDANTKIVSEALTAKEGVTYYEPVRKYPGKEESAQPPCPEQQCNNYCCATTPCQHGGTCYEVCDLKKRRFNCTCTPGYTGHRCQLQETQHQSPPMQEPQSSPTPMQETQSPSTPLQETQPPSTPMQETQPPSTPMQETQPPSTPMQETQPPSTPMQDTQPPSTPMQETQPPSTPLQDTQPPLTPTQVTQPPLPPRSCRDVVTSLSQKENGIYQIVDDQNVSFPVYCDFGSEPWAAWTLIQSHSLENNNAFKHKAFYQFDVPINQDAPEWDNYRLSMSRMKSIRSVSSHWRATCNFSTDNVVDYRDYLRASLSVNDLFEVPSVALYCARYDHVDVRGNRCENCTAFTAYSAYYGFHIDSWTGNDNGCDFNGRPNGGLASEDNFGFYGTQNPSFRCTSKVTSTTQFWIGGK